MAPSIPTTEPASLTLGDTWQWTRSFGEYPASDGWALSYTVVGPDEFEISGSAVTASGNAYAVVFNSDASLPGGTYQWFARLSKTGERVTIDRGVFTLIADTQSQLHCEKMLAAIEAVIEDRVTADVESYTIGGRSVVKMPSAELRKWRAYYAAEVAKYRRGGKFFSAVRVSFS